MSKGIVMEMTRRRIIVMTQQGSFEQIPRKGQSCEIGEEISYSPAKRAWKLPAVMTTAAAAVIFCLFLAISLPGQRQQAADPVVAYISIDINPSVEMGIDSRENVLELNGLNQDGTDIIRSIPYKGKTLSEVASLLLDKAEQGALGRGEGDIVIASTAVGSSGAVNDTLLAAKLKDQVAQHLQKAHPDKVSSYVVTAFAAPVELRVKAREDGLSTGKYALWLDAKSQGTTLPLQTFRDTSIRQIAKENSDFGQLIHNGRLPGKADFKELLEEEVSGKLDQKIRDQKNGKAPASGITNGSDVRDNSSGDKNNGKTGGNSADKHNIGSAPASNINGGNVGQQSSSKSNSSNKDRNYERSSDNNSGNGAKQNNDRNGSDYRNYIPPAIVPAPITPAPVVPVQPAVTESPGTNKGKRDEPNDNNNNDPRRGEAKKQYDQKKDDMKKKEESSKQEDRNKREDIKNENERQNEDSKRKQQENSPRTQPGSSNEGQHSTDHRNERSGD